MQGRDLSVGVEDYKLGFIVPVTKSNLTDLLAHPNFACGLVEAETPDREQLIAELNEAEVACLAPFVPTGPNGFGDDVPLCDAVVLDADNFGEQFEVVNGKYDTAVYVTSRHQAMELAERGADMPIFDASFANGQADAAWWQEMMALPCALDVRGLGADAALKDMLSEEVLPDFWLLTAEQISRHDLTSL